MPTVKFTTDKGARESRLLLAALLLLWVGRLAAPVHAHPVPFSYLDLRLGPGQLDGILVAHTVDLARELQVTPADALLDPGLAEPTKEAILGLLRPRLVLAADGRALGLELSRIEPLPDRQALALHLRFREERLPGLLSVRCSLFPDDPQHQTFLSVYENGALVRQEIFNRDHAALDHFTGGREGSLAALKKFIPEGVTHIFTGPDHVLFILGLLLPGGGLLRLLTIVTAFTLAHSVTLSLAALNLVSPPEHLIEPAIALSIIYVGVDNLMVGKGGRDVRVWVAFFFGLLHGFGFAGVLREAGLPPQALGWSLFAFNFGVEVGQACIVVVAASLLAALRSRGQVLGRRVLEVGSVGIILAGSYWFVERVFF